MPHPTQPLPSTLGPFIWRYLRNKKWYLAGFLLVALVWSVEMSLSPYLLRSMINVVVATPTDQVKMMAEIFTPAILYVAMSVLLNLNFRLYDYLLLRFYPAIKSEVSKDVFSYLLHHSYTFFQNTFTGTLTKKIYDLVETEALITIANEWFLARVIALLIASITLFKVVHPIFGFILFIWAIMFVYLSYRASKKTELFSRKYSETGSTMNGALSDSIANVMSTKLFHNIPYEVSALEKHIDRLVDSDRELQWHNLKINFMQGVGITVLVGAMLAALIYGRFHGWITVGDFAFVLGLSITFLMAVQNLGQQMQRFFKIVGTCNEALTFIRVPHEITDAPNARPLRIQKGEIKFKDVTFQYEGNAPLFNHLSITLRPGEKVGLVGYSGGGKSTFIKLILRLIDTPSGQILIDDQDIKTVTQSSLRTQIGTLPQEPDLFHRTLMENIRFAKPDASDEEVIEASKKAKCHEFISELPQQYYSLVGERGVKLSGGQKQRIAIARAFLKNAPILILDEATSSLDSITEHHIQESLHNVMKNKTTIVIAHRLSTLKDMDRILVFVKGEIVEDGALNSLLQNKNGHFYQLWHRQAQGFIPDIKI